MSRDHLAQLREAAPVILPSLLLCDFGNLEREVERLLAAGVQALHLDVMDGIFVPNMTYGMPIVAAFRKLTDLPLDVHLMIEKPEQYIRQFQQAGADVITIHAEAVDDVASTLRDIHSLGCGAGVAINPDTPVDAIVDALPEADLALMMSVNAGFGGQAFNPIALDKIREVRRLNSDVLIEIDGGVNLDTIGRCTEAGADLLVVGSAIFGKPDYITAVRDLNSAAVAAS
ncbi:ribulose-phosphate 3-epimerase [Blastopirellula retiformator]|uniref:Ribulose-phosphate 3-epimerase n=1 Tax=Blastopirellula retiformator TaxID=2527970 RepID=A0A5C5V217_9BACT|nr:ribulose-phosphate 3-epimerase [Blastopirellula retiformator]TWT32616.1 Ribulose-phosphate 3-epimerase [Blastopirellula retiformator]